MSFDHSFNVRFYWDGHFLSFVPSISPFAGGWGLNHSFSKWGQMNPWGPCSIIRSAMIFFYCYREQKYSECNVCDTLNWTEFTLFMIQPSLLALEMLDSSYILQLTANKNGVFINIKYQILSDIILPQWHCKKQKFTRIFIIFWNISLQWKI